VNFKWTAFICCLLLGSSICLSAPEDSVSQINTPVSNAVIAKKKLLVLHSYYKGFEWTDSIDQGIVDALSRHAHDVSIYTEYMDLKRFPEYPHIESLRQVYRIKYSKTRFDAILSTDDHAFQFPLQFGDELFPGTPLIFCGVNDFDPAMLKGHTNFTGVVEHLDIKATDTFKKCSFCGGDGARDRDGRPPVCPVCKGIGGFVVDSPVIACAACAGTGSKDRDGSHLFVLSAEGKVCGTRVTYVSIERL
jgi:hypothetical protein